MRAKYRQMLIRFREDDPGHMEAWEYLHGGTRSAADVVADLVRGRDAGGSNTAVSSEKQILDMLSDVQRLCRSMNERAGREAGPTVPLDNQTDCVGQEVDRSEEEVESGIFDFALDMGD